MVQALGMVGEGETLPLIDKIGLWNNRDLNKTSKQNEMQVFMHNSKVSLFRLLETNIKRAKAQIAILNLCSGWSFTTNLTTHDGGRIWLV